MALRLSSGVMDVLVHQAVQAHPLECCGLLLGSGALIVGIQPAGNVHADPATRFEIDPATLIAAHRAARQGGPQVVGCYHSHPSGPAEPSATDRALTAGDGTVWAIIGRDAAGGWQVRFWRSGTHGFQALPSPAASR